MAFALNLYPVTYIARYNPATEKWDEEWLASDKVNKKKLKEK